MTPYSGYKHTLAASRSMLRVFICLCIGGTLLFAGNVALTGHDDDYHRSTAAQAQTAGMIAFARNGSTLPVLSFDHGTKLTTLLTTIGVPFTNVDPDAGVPAASLFNVSVYSAIVVASDSSCGGCDNTTTSSANLAAAASSIATFFNAGGGIVAFTAGSNSAYYSFLPASATNPGTVSCSTCFTQTPAGVGVGIPAVNGDIPHNYFPAPGTSGMDPAWQVAETYTGPASGGVSLTNAPFTVFIANGTIGGGGFTPGVPVPPSIILIGTGLGGAALFGLKRRLMARRKSS